MEKTAMQEMLLNIESIESKTTDQEQLYMLTSLKVCAMVLLEKEKEQIINAYQQGHGDAGWTEDKYEPLEYYNQTYNQNK